MGKPDKVLPPQVCEAIKAMEPPVITCEDDVPM